MPAKNPFPVLVAEDDPDDSLLFTLAFRKTNLPWRIIHVMNGDHAIKCLSGLGPYANREVYPLPRLVLLDIKMPMVDGFELLSWMQQQPNVNQLPAVVISSSGLKVDIDRATRLGAREYHVKPTEPETFIDLLLGIHQRWLTSGSPGANGGT